MENASPASNLAQLGPGELVGQGLSLRAKRVLACQFRTRIGALMEDHDTVNPRATES